MRHKTCYSVRAQLVDHDGTVISSPQIVEKLAGLACHDDSVLHHAELPFAEEAALRGGYPRVAIDGQGRLLMRVEVDAERKLTRHALPRTRTDRDLIENGCKAVRIGPQDLSAASSNAHEITSP